MMASISTMKARDLLRLQVEIFDEMRSRKIIRTNNLMTGDLGEYLFCKSFGWKQETNSQKAYDALDADGNRIQIKARRLNKFNSSRQLSAIRSLGGFDLLACVIFDHGYSVFRAALIPSKIVANNSSFQAHTNSYVFHLRDTIWDISGVKDVTQPISRALGVL